ncbi:hypothetical protein [Nocardia sp. alder85J]|uniref:hypothetical protein n=1 Tax=Nocardia sp. alder85J TaxID=2862949 RepID=UPI001CD30FB3|nr:hypothetical protein [Nocardia sp. alder85J]MCX4091140.1 hypothetical protein [Nocardia sp. alder85J]
MSHPALHARPRWQRTGHAYFPTAALVDGHWWVLRINSFPDHPLWTLFIDGERCFDVDDAPPAWGEPAAFSAPSLDEVTAARVVGPIQDFVGYGSEIGDPCDNPFCCG